HAEQRALADAGSAEQAETLPAPAGQQPVDRAHARAERRGHAFAVERVERRWIQRILLGGVDVAETVERPAEAIDHAPQEPGADGDRRHAPARDDPIARPDAGGRA